VYAKVLALKQSAENKESIELNEINELYDAITQVASHKDSLIKKTGSALKSIDTKIDQFYQSLSRLEEENSQLRNNQKAQDNNRQLKLLTSIIDEIDTFIGNTKEEYLAYVRKTIITVLATLDCYEYSVEFLDQDLIRYYKILNSSSTNEYRVVKSGFYVPIANGHRIIAYAELTAKGE
jgi:chromosome segregation ATPase